MLRSHALVATPHASRYLQQLGKHWSHKFETEFSATDAHIALPSGVARLAADSERLTVEVTAEDEAALAQLRDVVARHIERFAFRETLHFEWS